MRRPTIIRHNQTGNALVSVSLAVVALITISLIIAQGVRIYKYEQIAMVAMKRVEFVHDAMQKYYMDEISTGTSPSDTSAYPSSRSELISSGYIEECKPADEKAGKCLDMTKLPWVTTSYDDQKMSINVDTGPDGYPEFDLSLSVAGLEPTKLRNIVKSKLTQLPGFSDDGAGTITFTFSRPGQAVNFESLVSRDGSKPMTDNWDYGNYYLENVKDISFTGINDRTAITGMVKMGSVYVDDNQGEPLNKPDCPTGYKPGIEVWTVGMGGSDPDNLGYNTRSFAAWYTDDSDKWTLYFRSLAEDSGGTPTFFYQGAVAYATWCEF